MRVRVYQRLSTAVVKLNVRASGDGGTRRACQRCGSRSPHRFRAPPPFRLSLPPPFPRNSLPPDVPSHPSNQQPLTTSIHSVHPLSRIQYIILHTYISTHINARCTLYTSLYHSHSMRAHSIYSSRFLYLIKL